MDSLATTNTLLTLLAVLGMVEALAFVVVLVAVALLLRRIAAVVEHVEAHYIAPAAARVHSILDDVGGVTSTVKADVHQLRAALRFLMRWLTIPSRWSDPGGTSGKETPHA